MGRKWQSLIEASQRHHASVATKYHLLQLIALHRHKRAATVASLLPLLSACRAGPWVAGLRTSVLTAPGLLARPRTLLTGSCLVLTVTCGSMHQLFELPL